ncbi:MAG TPA: HYR domain-containing protein, partial [Prolixibacteraceae bacterium]|nr:HYR domain-containing protein [Prolixibacteraceae bacterium]
TPAGSFTITQSPAAGAAVGIGTHLVTITIKDQAGNTVTCTANFTVTDNTNPVIVTCAPSQSAAANANCQAPVPNFTASVSVTDNCTPAGSFTITQSPAAGAAVGIGTHLVTITIKDQADNTTTCTANFTVTDETLPEINVQEVADLTVECGTDYTAMLTSWLNSNAGATATDNCDNVELEWNNDFNIENLSNGCGETGSMTVTFTVTDGAGNSSTVQATFTIEDTTPPFLGTIPADVTLDYPATLPVAPTVAATDNCDSQVEVTLNEVSTQTNNGESTDYNYTVTRTWTATDDCGNSASASQVITVEDKIAPNLDSEALDLFAECDGNGNLDELQDWLDAHGGATTSDPTVTWSYTLDATTPGCGNTQTAAYTFTATDGSGNATTTSASFIIQDTTDPVITAENISIEADENCDYDATPETVGYPDFSDICSDLKDTAYVDVVVDGQYPGEVIITRTWSVSDHCGNSATAQQTITVTGSDAPPTLELHDLTVYLTEEGKWTLNRYDKKMITAGSTPACGTEDDLDIVITPNHFDCDNVGTPVQVTVTATDFKGNFATGMAYVTVKDTIRPVALCKDTTVYLDAFGQVLIVPGAVNPGDDRESAPVWAKFFNDLEGGSYDNCGIAEMYLTQQIFTCENLGDNPVTLTVIDPSGNTATCQATVTVLDTIAPKFTPVADVVFTAQPGVCETPVPYPAVVAKDNCSATLELVEGLGASGMFPLGTTVETWKATDPSGNASLMTFKVTVNTFNAPPTITAVEDIVANEDPIQIEIPLTGISPNVDCATQQVISIVAASDNDELISALNLDYVPGSAIGTLVVTIRANHNGVAKISLTVKDNGGTENGGNDTTVETFTITVLPVNDAPMVVTPVADQFILLGNSLSVNLSGVFTDPDEDDVLTLAVTLANGNPLPAWMTFNPATGMLTGTPAVADLGVIEVKVTATDAAGTTASDNFLVVVLDPEKSTIKGTVLTSTGPVQGGVSVVLYTQSDQLLYVPVATVSVDQNGKFTFYNVADGTFLVKAVVDHAVHPNLFHTYYEAAILAKDATQLVINGPETETIQINMMEGAQQNGQFTVMGRVLKKTGQTDGVEVGGDNGEPAANIDMILKKNNIIIASTITGSDGKYSFTGLPAGEYDVFVEVPGYTQQVSVKVTLDADHPLKDNVNFTIWMKDPRVITDVNDIENNFNLGMYPNPTRGKVNVSLTWNDIRDLQVTVYNLVGVELFRKAYRAGDQISFDLSQNVSGMYLVKFEAEGFSAVKKLVLDKK